VPRHPSEANRSLCLIPLNQKTKCCSLNLFEMSIPMYRVERLSGVPTFSPEYAGSVALVSQATQTQVWISAVYFVVALGLLLLPLALPQALAGHKRRLPTCPAHTLQFRV
jgi:hypothetical protein